MDVDAFQAKSIHNRISWITFGSSLQLIAWHLDWIFQESYCSDDETDKKEVTILRTGNVGDKSWGDLFAVTEGSWKCFACIEAPFKIDDEVEERYPRSPPAELFKSLSKQA